MSVPTELSYWAIGLLIVQIIVWTFNMIRSGWEQREFDHGKIPGRWKKKMEGVEEFYFCCSGPWGLGLKNRILNNTHLIHEWTHIYTAAPWIISFCETFGWLLWYSQHGLIWALAINWFASRIFIQMPFEAIADLASLIASGPKQFIRDMGDVYRVITKKSKEAFDREWLSNFVIGINMTYEMLCYPLWRLPLHIYGNYLERQAYIACQAEEAIRMKISDTEELLAVAQDDTVIQHLVEEIEILVKRREQLSGVAAH